jgi:phosphoribosylanthranilate isomerase
MDVALDSLGKPARLRRTRIKMCGMTRAEDVRTACALGADAVGFVCAPSARRVDPARLAELAAAIAPFVTPVLLFVDAPAATVREALAVLPHASLQFHGNEDEVYCRSFGRPYLRAVPMAAGIDLLEFESRFASALALLADSAGKSRDAGDIAGAPAGQATGQTNKQAAGLANYGGTGQSFDWSLLPPAAHRRLPLVLAGGLEAANVAAAIRQCQPFAVDVSSGIEEARGFKSASRMHDFVAAVRRADLHMAAMQGAQ